MSAVPDFGAPELRLSSVLVGDVEPLEVPLAPLPAGSYRLEIHVTDNASGAMATRDVPFTVQPAAP